MAEREAKKKKKKADAEVLSWQQKKELSDVDEHAVRRQVEELISWTTMIEGMDDKQLKEYVMNRPENLQTAAGRAGKSAPGKKARRATKPRSSSSSSSKGLMAAIWKFHREEDVEEASLTFKT